MKIFRCLFFTFVVASTFSVNGFGQDSTAQEIIFPSGISLDCGFGSYTLKDEYISKEKYSGSLPFYQLNWTKPHDGYVYHMSLTFQKSKDLKSNNVSAEILQFTVNQGFNYALPEFSLFDKTVKTYLGPATELFYYNNKQHIAVSGFEYAKSFALLISGGISSHLLYNLAEKLNLEGSLDFSLISFGSRMVDSEESDETPVKILTIFSGTNINFRLGIRYYLFDSLSLKASYLFNLTRIKPWEPFISASDNFIGSINYEF